MDPRAIAFINELSEIFNQIFDFKIVLTPTWNMNLKAIKNLFSDFSFAKYITDILPNSMDNFTFLREYCGDIHNTGDLHYVCHYAEIQKYLSEQRMQPQMNLVVTGNNFIHLEKFADDFISTKGSFSEEDFANILIRLKANLWGHDEECKENDFILYTPYLAITQQDIVKTESLEEVEESELSYDDENFLEQDEEVVDFSAQDLQGVDFSRRNFSHGKFVNTNLTNANLSFANLQHADLSGAILRGAKLNKASLKNAILHQADLESADCSSANFSDAILTQANLARAVMTKARFIMADGREANLEEVNLKKANLYDAQFHKATLTNANLKNASLMSAKLNGAILLRAKLVGADLTDANLSGADLQEADFTNADLTNLELRDAKTQGAINLRQAFDRGIKKQKERQEATLLRPLLYVSPIQQPEIPKLSGNFSGMDFTMTPTFFSAPSSVNIFIGANFSKATFLQMVIQDINFSHADFSQACFAGAKLCDVNFMGANLTNANMQDTIITDCIFSESTMNQIILSGARISHSSFHSANMDDADLMKAHFVGTKDEEITLCYASMKRANLNETEFFYADLSEADLSKANLEKAKFNQCAIRETNFLLAQNCSGEVLHYQREQDKNEQIKQQRMKRWESTLRLEEIRIQNFEQKRDEDRKELETEANRRRFVGEIRDDEERVALAYSKLGLVKTEALSESDINKAYRNMIKQFHPDRGGLIEKFNPINEAFEIIQAYLGIGKYSDLPRL